MTTLSPGGDQVARTISRLNEAEICNHLERLIGWADEEMFAKIVKSAMINYRKIALLPEKPLKNRDKARAKFDGMCKALDVITGRTESGISLALREWVSDIEQGTYTLPTTLPIRMPKEGVRAAIDAFVEKWPIYDEAADVETCDFCDEPPVWEVRFFNRFDEKEQDFDDEQSALMCTTCHDYYESKSTHASDAMMDAEGD